jgi:hypothetical protein
VDRSSSPPVWRLILILDRSQIFIRRPKSSGAARQPVVMPRDLRMKTTRLRRTFEENVDEVMLPSCRRPPQVMRSELRALTDEARN